MKNVAKLMDLEIIVDNIENSKLRKIIMERLPNYKFNFFSNHTERGTRKVHTDYSERHIDRGHTDHKDRHDDRYKDGYNHKDYMWRDGHQDTSEGTHTDEHRDSGHKDHSDGYNHNDHNEYA
jgi:hypothetical protein